MVDVQEKDGTGGENGDERKRKSEQEKSQAENMEYFMGVRGSLRRRKRARWAFWFYKHIVENPNHRISKSVARDSLSWVGLNFEKAKDERKSKDHWKLLVVASGPGKRHPHLDWEPPRISTTLPAPKYPGHTNRTSTLRGTVYYRRVSVPMPLTKTRPQNTHIQVSEILQFHVGSDSSVAVSVSHLKAFNPIWDYRQGTIELLIGRRSS